MVVTMFCSINWFPLSEKCLVREQVVVYLVFSCILKDGVKKVENVFLKRSKEKTERYVQIK